MIQEFLNKEDKYLWALLSNGYTLRILRDNLSLTRQSFIEFDLEAIMNGELYADFALLWLLCHQSRFEGEKAENCWLEKWSKTVRDQGLRALDQLRSGVEQAIKYLGSGFLTNPHNKELHDKLFAGTLSVQDYYRQLLRTVYRLLFLFVAEERDLLLLPGTDPKVKEFYYKYYSLSKLKKVSEKIKGTKHDDFWIMFKLIIDKLCVTGSPELGLPVLGGWLFSPNATADINDCLISNRLFLDAIRSLCIIEEGNTRRIVDYKNLRSEELGSIYEALLELQPQLNKESGEFYLTTVAGSERKTTGSYYTHDSLVQCLLNSALDPVLTDAVKKPDPEKALLELKVCDPACGSGHFLIGAAHRIAKKLAAVRSGEEEPSPEESRKAVRDVISRCLYGVDINAMSVELCKVALWMEALEPGRPLSFLDHHIQCGNSLLGATPALLKKGIPDEAFSAIEGDDKEVCKEYKKKNKQERVSGQTSLFSHDMKPMTELQQLTKNMLSIDTLVEDTLEQVITKQKRYEDFIKSGGYSVSKFVADTWCSAFVWKKTKEFPFPITESVFRNIQTSIQACEPWMGDEINRLAEQYQFFHWHIAFPDVFYVPDVEQAENEQCGWSGGFDCVLGNPPWEHTELKEVEYFASLAPEISAATNAAERKKLINILKNNNPILYKSFIEEKRHHEALGIIIGESTLYPLAGVGRINTYAVFSELNRLILSSHGITGFIVPTGIATDDTTKFYFQDLVRNKVLISLYDFENKKGLFPGVHRMTKFCLITISGINRKSDIANFAFFAYLVEDLNNPDKLFSLTPDEIELINPNTKTCPIFRSKNDAEITKNIYKITPVLKNELSNSNSWEIEIYRMLNGSDDSYLFIEKELDKTIKVYESKMFWQYDHRYSSYNGTDFTEVAITNKKDVNYLISTHYYIPENKLPDKFIRKLSDWYLAYRVISNATNERTLVSCILPRSTIINSANIIDIRSNPKGALLLLANINSFITDYICRQSMGGSNLHSYILQQLPILSARKYQNDLIWLSAKTEQWVFARSLELTYTATDLKQYITLITEDKCNPFIWDVTRRFIIKCELDALYFHLYEITKDTVNYIMDTFTIVKDRDEQQYGEYRTKRVILEIYDEMAEAIKAGKPYQTKLDPPPGDPRAAHQ